MRFDYAPMEGLTDSIYRQLHQKWFPGIHRYYTPFFSPTIHRCLTNREERELPMADILKVETVPQVLTKVAEDFLWMARQCRDRGYRRINLNLGCPSGTVVSKGKGSGMLADRWALDDFLEAIFKEEVLPISVKTRVGISDEEEFPALLDIFNQYPIQELIIHPRVRKDFYESPVRMDAFRYGVEHSKIPLCYNGNLCSLSQIRNFSEEFPQIDAVMLGRGLTGDPGMLTPGGTTAEALEGFFGELLEAYISQFGGPRNAMFRLKENWRYLIHRFEDSEKLGKRLRKTTDVQEYRAITAEIFHTLPLKKELEPDW